MNWFSVFIFCGLIILVNNQYVDPWDVRCHVCKATIQEMEDEIAKVSPNKMIDVGGSRLNSEGNFVSKKIPYVKSELYLTDLMENICDKMDNYAKAVHKKTGKTAVLKFMVNGQMNPEIGEHEFVQDGDLNKSLKHYCLEILDDHDDAFLKYFMAEKLEDNIDVQICSIKAKYCKDEPLPEEYKLEVDEYQDEL